MLITGKKRPFRFVLKQQKPLNRGKNGVFHIKTVVGECHPERRRNAPKSKDPDPYRRGGGGIPLPSALPLLRHSRAFPFTSSWSVATGSIHFIPSFDRGKSSVTPSCGRSPPRNAPAPLQKNNAGGEPSVFCQLECRRLGWSREPMSLFFINIRPKEDSFRHD